MKHVTWKHSHGYPLASPWISFSKQSRGAEPLTSVSDHLQPAGGPREHMGSLQSWAWSPASGGLGVALQLCGGDRVSGESKDSLKGCESVVFSHCHCDGLGTLVMEEVGCQAGKRRTAASEQVSAVMSLVLAPQRICTAHPPAQGLHQIC